MSRWIEDAENHRDGETADALRRLVKLEQENERPRVALWRIEGVGDLGSRHIAREAPGA